MLGLTRVPPKVYDFLFRFKPSFRCPQARHFVLFCWLLTALCLEQGKGTLTGLHRQLPPRLKYWALLRLVRSGWWCEQELLRAMSADVLVSLPPPADGRLYVVGDLTLIDKRGEQQPLGRVTRHSQYAAYGFGLEVLLVLACWGHYRIPVGCVVLDPAEQGAQNHHCRRLLREFQRPQWVREVIVVADAGFAASATFRQLEQQGYKYVCAAARTRKFTDGKSLRDFVQHLPKSYYRRVKTTKPDGRRRDYWIYASRKVVHGIGDVTIILSKTRRNNGPKQTKIIVTNLDAATPGAILSIYARRWGVELTFKELKSGLHLGEMQVTKEAERVRRGVGLSVLAYLLLVKLYGAATETPAQFSIFCFKQQFFMEVCHAQQNGTQQKWQRKLDKLRLAA
jgi:Transposase DDE domain